eukprot:TRINITY_DN1402_c0_g1_i1.p1 TRINITY_DN1402_c0_g1~~TRINITY_DN1402_c0_g1_i1.p1  ORF type:complete len:383 (+),score=124.47 TRINITY_DN1402_c0_g1_i1:110-1258(+)
MSAIRFLGNFSRNNVGLRSKFNDRSIKSFSKSSSSSFSRYDSFLNGPKGFQRRRMQTEADVLNKNKPSEHLQQNLAKKVENPIKGTNPQELRQIFESVKVEEILDKKGKDDIIFIDENSMVYDAVKMMSKKDMGAVVVTSNGKPKGIFTERDYMTKLILKGRSSKKTPIKDVTEYKLHTVSPTNTLGECGEMMIKKIIRHLPIVAADGKYLGMISVKDVAEHMVRAGHKASDVKLAQNPDTVTDVFNKLGRVSSEECFVDANDSVLKALQLMDKHRIGAVFVTEGQKLVGIFTERDYLHKVILQEKASKTTEVGDVMTPDVVVVNPNEQIGRCLTLMVKGKFRNLPVVPLVGDHELDSGDYNTVLGIITLVDVIRFLLNVGK